VHQIVQIIQQAAWYSTTYSRKSPNAGKCAPTITQKILDKKKSRKRWQNTRSSQDKAKLKKAAKELKQLLNDQKQKFILTYSESLTATEATEYLLWKATKRLLRPGTPILPPRTEGREWA
jgi:hypothetical protein